MPLVRLSVCLTDGLLFVWLSQRLHQPHYRSASPDIWPCNLIYIQWYLINWPQTVSVIRDMRIEEK